MAQDGCSRCTDTSLPFSSRYRLRGPFKLSRFLRLRTLSSCPIGLSDCAALRWRWPRRGHRAKAMRRLSGFAGVRQNGLRVNGI